MNRTEFLRIVAGYGLTLAGCVGRREPGPGAPAVSRSIEPQPVGPAPRDDSPASAPELKNWVWITTDLKTSDEQWKRKFARLRAAGIDAIVPEVFNGRKAQFRSQHLPQESDWLARLLPLAKAEGLEVHAWTWCMPCNIEAIQAEHPEWYAVNGQGESAVRKPAYVDYYKFLCPTRAPVQEFLQRRVRELAAYSELDGIHLDYIRFPDVILAEALQPKYNIVQDREYPQYDYCYCEVCRDAFKSASGLDPLNLDDPSGNDAWRQFRYDRITHLVNQKLLPIIREHKKQATAAVFPNWKMVRQQWPKWHLDAVLPMLYNGFYNKGVPWIGKQTAAGVQSLPDTVGLYSGLFIPDLDPTHLAKAVRTSLAAGARGVSLFSEAQMTETHWEALAQVLREAQANAASTAG